MSPQLPILYSFRRCPYAMRARLAIHASGTMVEHREILLKDKPAAMLQASPKGTVPVVVLPDGRVIDESREVMMWALQHNDPEQWYYSLPTEQQTCIDDWIDRNDTEFKPWLDKYKYSVGYPEHSEAYYRTQGEVFLHTIEQQLNLSAYLLGNATTLADVAIFPFIRQFAFVDKHWFDNAPYPRLQSWLNGFLASDAFQTIMQKYPLWQDN